MRGFPTRCISFDDDPQSNPHIRDNTDWSIVPTRRGPLGHQYAAISRRTNSEILKEIESADIIVVHLLYRYHAVWAAQCARQCGKPLIVVPHGSLDPYVFTYRALRKKLWLKAYHDLLFRDSLVLYATDREREKAASAVGNVRAKSLFWPMDDETGRLADMLPHVTSQPRRLLLVGRLHPMKRVLETVRGFCRANVPGWQLVVIGAESNEISTDDLRTAAGGEWNRSVVYRGVLDRQSLYFEYRNASALILASHRENFGHVVAEAMRFGLPVLISDDVDLCTLVRQAGAGRVFPIRSEDDILDCLAGFLRLTTDELEKLGQSAQSAATEHFDFQTFANSYNTILETLVSQGAEPAPNRVPQIA
jgi:glycosyltransferase involved in cell wall biosynthesis